MTDKRAGIINEPLEPYDRFRSALYPRNVHGETLATWASIFRASPSQENFTPGIASALSSLSRLRPSRYARITKKVRS